MKNILLKILHYIWFRKDNLYSIYKIINNDSRIHINGKIDFEEFKAYSKIFEESGVAKESFDLDDNILSGDIISDELSLNNSMNLTFNQQTGPSCVPTALIRMINYNTEVDITEEKRLTYIEDLYKVWILTTEWSSVQKVADYLREAIKKDFWKDLVYFKETIGSDKYNKLIDNNYAHGLWGWISSEYVLDFRTDGEINIENYTFKEAIKYYHLFMNLPSLESNKRGWNIVENYNKRFWIRNIYKNAHIAIFGKKGVFFNYWYFFIDSSNINPEKLIEAKKEITNDIEGNRFYKHLIPHIDTGYETMFNDYEDTEAVNAWEVKALIDLGYIRKTK